MLPLDIKVFDDAVFFHVRSHPILNALFFTSDGNFITYKDFVSPLCENAG